MSISPRSRPPFAFKLDTRRRDSYTHGTIENSSKDPNSFKGGLQRLARSAYQGNNWVHWTMTIRERKTGWLTSLSHSRIREALLHSLIRHDLVCAGYCLMPDHGHFLIGGLRHEPASDQKLAMTLFRREWNRQLKMLPGDFKLQKQAYDHALRESEYTRRSAFEAVASYIFENPKRSALVEHFEDWDFMGTLIPGYPDLNPQDDNFWDRFWKIYYKRLANNGG